MKITLDLNKGKLKYPIIIGLVALSSGLVFFLDRQAIFYLTPYTDGSHFAAWFQGEILAKCRDWLIFISLLPVVMVLALQKIWRRLTKED